MLPWFDEMSPARWNRRGSQPNENEDLIMDDVIKVGDVVMGTSKNW